MNDGVCVFDKNRFLSNISNIFHSSRIGFVIKLTDDDDDDEFRFLCFDFYFYSI